MPIQVPGDYDLDAQIASEHEAALGATPPASAPPQGGASAPATKAQTWEDRLALAKITPDQAHEILAQILQRGYFEKTFPLYGGKISVTLRTRLSWHRTQLMSELDTVRTNDAKVHGELELRHCLAGSLVRVGQTAYPVVEINDNPEVAQTKLNNAFNLLARVPDTLLTQALYPLIGRFDTAVYAALSQDAASSF